MGSIILPHEGLKFPYDYISFHIIRQVRIIDRMKRKQIIRRIRSSFVCMRCNKCCTAPGAVYVKGRDIDRLASHLNLTREDFLERYCMMDEGRWELKLQKDGACIFLNSEGCTVHTAKPSQCRSFPMVWRSPESFNYCEGIKALKAKS